MSRGGHAGRGAPDYSTAIPVVRGALALAAEFFPRHTVGGKTYVQAADALFFLSGQMDKWSGWPHLPPADKALIARLLRWRPVELANRNVFSDWLDILMPGHIHDFRALADGTLLLETTRPARQIAEECAQQLWLERQVKDRHPAAIASNGDFATWIRGHLPGSGYAQATYSLSISHRCEGYSPRSNQRLRTRSALPGPCLQARPGPLTRRPGSARTWLRNCWQCGASSTAKSRLLLCPATPP
jgi:hypothetical protein